MMFVGGCQRYYRRWRWVNCFCSFFFSFCYCIPYGRRWYTLFFETHIGLVHTVYKIEYDIVYWMDQSGMCCKFTYQIVLSGIQYWIQFYIINGPIWYLFQKNEVYNSVCLEKMHIELCKLYVPQQCYISSLYNPDLTQHNFLFLHKI